MPPLSHAAAIQDFRPWLFSREAQGAALAEPLCKPSEFMTRTTGQRVRARRRAPRSKIGVSVKGTDPPDVHNLRGKTLREGTDPPDVHIREGTDPS